MGLARSQRSGCLQEQFSDREAWQAAGPAGRFNISSLKDEKDGLFYTWIIQNIEIGGYTAIAAGMAMESACLPVPSELIFGFAGYLVFLGEWISQRPLSLE